MTERTYSCPECGQIVTKTAEEMEGNRLTQGKLPAFLTCGRCYSDGKSVRMWGEDVTERDPLLYDGYGILRKPIPIDRSAEKDISFARCKRWLIRVVYHGKLSNAELIERAKAEVARVTKRRKVNAIAVHFCRSTEEFGDRADAGVDWCTEGIWGRADKVKTGDYRRHRYVVEFNRTGGAAK